MAPGSGTKSRRKRSFYKEEEQLFVCLFVFVNLFCFFGLFVFKVVMFLNQPLLNLGLS